MKYYGELRDIETQIVIATSDICKCENEARRVIAGEAFIRHFVKANTDAQVNYPISRTIYQTEL